MKAKSILTEILIVSVLCGLALGDWTEPVPVTEVNTEYDDQESFLSFDGLTLYFTRVNTDTFYWARIYKAARPEPYGPFTSVEEISTLNYSSGHVSGPWVSPDNLRMYYWRSGPTAVRRLKVSERADVTDPWPEGSNISELNSLANVVGGASLTQDELVIVFTVEDIPGGIGGYDIYIADRPDIDSPFGNVRNLSEINTTSNEGGGCMSPDGLTVYFNSDRNGDWQLFKATRASLNETFGHVEHLTIFDTPGGNSAHPCISGGGTAFYFTSWISGQPPDIYVSYWIVDLYEDAINNILDAIAEKLETLEKVNAALEKEWTAYEALQELLDSGDYGYLSKGDIVTAMQKIHSSIQHQEQSIDALERSIEKLKDALASVGWGPVACWKFDEGSGTIAYDSAGDNHGTVYGATWTTGQINGALSFDGVDDYVDIPYDSSLDINASEGITLSVWIKLNSYPDSLHQAPIFGLFDSTNAGYKNHLFIHKSIYGNLIAWDQFPPSYGWIDSIKPVLATWYHVVVVEDSIHRAIYINGSLDSSDNLYEPYEGNLPDTIRIGNRADGLAHFYFDGSIDEVVIYDKALSDQEIELLYHNILAE